MLDFLKNFSLDKALDVVIETGAEFLTGRSRYDDYGIGDKGEFDTSKSTSGGFLGLVSAGAKHFVAMQDDKDGNYFTTPEIERFEARSRYQRTPGGLSRGQTRWSPRSVDYQEALRRRLQNQNFETSLEAKTAQYTVRPTKGRTRPVSPGTTTIKRTMTAPRIKTGD